MNESCTIKPLPLFKGERRIYRGILQPFADHAHDHYVFGIVREGERELVLNGELLRIKKDDILVFNPGDAHGCTQASESPFAYDSFTVAAEVLDGERFGFPNNTDDLLRERLEEVFSLLDRCLEEDALEAFVAFEQMLVAKPDMNPPNPKHEEAAVHQKTRKGKGDEGHRLFPPKPRPPASSRFRWRYHALIPPFLRSWRIRERETGLPTSARQPRRAMYQSL